jgi:iron(III) transport system substrate-binding protein
MSPAGQSLGAKANSLQVPANKTFRPTRRSRPSTTCASLKYDFEKYGKAAERKRLIERWEKEVNSLPR